MATLMSGESYNLKLAYLLLRIAPGAVRVKFDYELHPDRLKTTLNKKFAQLFELKRQNKIHKDQWELVFPNQGQDASSKNFDITLMIFLLKHVTDMDIGNIPPTTTSNLNDNNALSIIKFYRNWIVHSCNWEITSADFESYWDQISKAVIKLGGIEYTNICDTTRQKIFNTEEQDQTIEVVIAEKKLEQFEKRMVEIESNVESFCKSKKYFPVDLGSFDACEEHRQINEWLFTTGDKVIRMFAEHRLLQKLNITFDMFLTRNKHLFFHQYKRSDCLSCMCQIPNCYVKNILKNDLNTDIDIFEQIYVTSSSQTKLCNQYVAISQTTPKTMCLHTYDVKKEVSLDSLDLECLNVILCSTGSLKNTETLPYKIIKEIYKSCDTYTDAETANVWTELQTSILQLAEPERYKNMVEFQVKILNRLKLLVNVWDSISEKIKRNFTVPQDEIIKRMKEKEKEDFQRTVSETVKAVMMKDDERHTKMEKSITGMKETVVDSLTEYMDTMKETLLDNMKETVVNEMKETLVDTIKVTLTELLQQTVLNVSINQKTVHPSNQIRHEQEAESTSGTIATLTFTNLDCNAENAVITSGIAEKNNEDHDNENASSSMTILTVEKGSIRLCIAAGPSVFDNPETLRRSIRTVIEKVLNAGNVDTSIEGTINVELTFESHLTRDQIQIVQLMVSNGSKRYPGNTSIKGVHTTKDKTERRQHKTVPKRQKREKPDDDSGVHTTKDKTERRQHTTNPKRQQREKPDDDSDVHTTKDKTERRQQQTVQKRPKREKPKENNDVVELKRQNPELNQYIQGINDYISQLEERLTVQETRIQQLEVINETKTGENYQTSASDDEFEEDEKDQSSKVEQERMEQEKEIEGDLEATNSILKDKIQQIESSNESITTELSKTTIELKEIKDSSTAMEEKLTEATKDIDDLWRHNTLLTLQLEGKTERNAFLEKKNEELEKRNLQAEIYRVSERNENLDRRNFELMKALKQTEDSKEWITKELRHTDTVLRETRQENTNLQEEVYQYMMRDNESHNTINRLTREMGNLQTRVRDLELGAQRRHPTDSYVDRGKTGQTSSILERIGAAIRGFSGDSDSEEKSKKESSTLERFLASLLGISEDEANTGQKGGINTSTDTLLNLMGQFFGLQTGDTKKQAVLESTGVETWPNIFDEFGKMQQSAESLKLFNTETEYENTTSQEWSKTFEIKVSGSQNEMQSSFSWELPWILPPKSVEPLLCVEMEQEKVPKADEQCEQREVSSNERSSQTDEIVSNEDDEDLYS